MPEKHELSFEEFDARVEVEDDGRVWVSFHESSKCAFTLSASDLSLVAAFVEKQETSSWWIVSHSESAATVERTPAMVMRGTPADAPKVRRLLDEVAVRVSNDDLGHALYEWAEEVTRLVEGLD